MTMTKRERMRRLGALKAPDPTPVRIGRVHRAAALAGVPTTLPAIRYDIQMGDNTRKGEQARKLRSVAFKGSDYVKRNIGGQGTVTMLHPGAAGHEKCSTICLVYS